jgi:hypothetical protein
MVDAGVDADVDRGKDLAGLVISQRIVAGTT